MSDWYVLDPGGVVRGPVSEDEWRDWYVANPGAKQIARDRLPGDVEVFTIFLGLDYGVHETPVLFETMIFEGQHVGDRWRYRSLTAAQAGHAAIVAALRAGLDPYDAVPPSWVA